MCKENMSNKYISLCLESNVINYINHNLNLMFDFQTINSTDISTVRKLGKPPYLITLIMDCVLILFKRNVLKVKPDPDKSFLEPNWPMSLKVNCFNNK